MLFNAGVSRPIALCFAIFLLHASLNLSAGDVDEKQNPVSANASFAEPALSPDQSEIAFVSGGDIWTVPAAGGEARLLVSHPATESRPLYSPDGKRLAFLSTRSGNGNIYVLTLATSELKRITFGDVREHLDGWSFDGKWLYFSTAAYDIGSMNDIYRVSSDGGTPMAVSADRYANEFFSAPSPDGTAIAFTARGIASSQWWRKGHSHLDECEICIRRDGTPPIYERLTTGGAKEMWPMWCAQNSSIFYVSDRSGAQNIWVKAIGGAGRQVTSFQDGRVLWPTISYSGSAIVFERDFGIWMLDVLTGQAKEIPITLRGAPSGPAIDHLTLTNRFQDFALSPDGRKIAFTVHGEVFAVSAKDGGDALRVTRTNAAEDDPAWAPDSKRLAYISARFGTPHVFMFDFSNNSESQLTNDALGDAQPVFSPDGTMVAFERDGRELRVLELASKKEHTAAMGDFDRPPLNSKRAFAWSPDSHWLAYAAPSSKSFRNISVVPMEGGVSRQVSFIANVYSNSLSWSADGTFLLFHTYQRTESGEIARIDLTPRSPKFREDQFREMFHDEPTRPVRAAQTPPAADLHKEPPRPEEIRKIPVKRLGIVFENIRQRIQLLPAGIDAQSAVVSPDGKTVVLCGGPLGQENLYTYALDEFAREPAVARQLTSTSGRKSDAQFSPDGKEVYYLEQGRINVVPLDTRLPRTLSITAEMDVDFAREKVEVFKQAWSYLYDNFFDEKFNGVDWPAMRDLYAPRIAAARTPDDMRRLISLMLGELNASHLDITPPFAYADPSVGRLGLRFDRLEYESAGRLRITEVVPLGPAAVAGIKSGEYLLAIGARPLSMHTNLDEFLSHSINRRVVLSVATAADGAIRRDVAARPINTTAEKALLYRQWVEERRAYVARVSGGRLGYIHMADMLQGSLSKLNADLDAENHARDGVVVDVRNNTGGFVNPYAIDVLSRRPYLTMTSRGHSASPARTILGQRALEAPTILVCNQHSLSDAEAFIEGYRSLKLGKVVGEPTAGWDVFTASAALLDGSMLRIPFTRVLTASGEPMEMHPRPVDIDVQRPVGESYTDHDCQLDAAVKELLLQIGKEKH